MDNIEQLYQKYFKDVFFYLKALSKNPDLAEELTQETFFKALTGISRFRGECDIRVWLCQIAKNTYFKYCDKNKKMVLKEVDESYADETISLEKDIIHKEQSQIARQILNEMEEPYRRVFYLRIFGELSFRSIGEAFNRTENWARVTYYRAKCKLAKEMEDQYGKNNL